MQFCTSCPSGVVFQAWMTGWNPTDFLRTISWPSWLARWIKLPTYNFICHEMYHCTWHCFMYLSESTWPLGTLCVCIFFEMISWYQFQSISLNFSTFHFRNPGEFRWIHIRLHHFLQSCGVFPVSCIHHADLHSPRKAYNTTRLPWMFTPLQWECVYVYESTTSLKL